MRFDWKDFIKKIAVLAVPVALQNLLATTGSMVDTMMLAPLGELTVGSVGLCAQFSSLMFSCYWGFVGGGILFYAQYYGAKDDDGIARAFGTVMTCMMTVALIFTGLAVLFPEVVMNIYTDKPHIQEIGIEYLRIAGFSYILNVLSVGISTLLRSTERVKIPLYGAIASVTSNMVLNYALIYGKLGLPAMGIRGAALATVISGLINLLVQVLMAKKQNYPYLFRFSHFFKWNKAWIREFLQKCFPIICNEVAIGIGNMIINIVLGRQSEEAIAAIAVLRILEGLVIGFFAGFSSAASVLVGKCVGSGELDTAYERAKRLVYLCGSVILVLCLILIALHYPILTALSLSGESLSIGTGLLIIYCVAAVVRMCNWTQNDTYRSAGDATFGTILEIVFMFVMVVPAVCLTGLYWHAPVLVVFACCYIDEPVRFVLMQIHMFSGKWIKPVTEQGKAAIPAFHKKRGIVKESA